MDIEIDAVKPAYKDWKKIVLYGLAVAILAGGLLARFSTRKGRAEEEFVQAAQSFVKWEEVIDRESDAFTALQGAIKKHPELEAHYDGRVAQNLLAVRDAEGARLFMDRALRRTGQSYFSEFSQTSLEISRGNFKQALEEAEALKEKMERDEAFWKGGDEGSALFAFNLLRVALLSQETGDYEKEQAAWKEMKLYGRWIEGEPKSSFIGHKGFDLLRDHLSVQETSLLEYMASREEALRESS